MNRFGCVLDLDDTLYLERDYVRSGFRAVAGLIGTESPDDADTLFDFLWADFVSGGRGSSFHALLDAFPGVARGRTAADLVTAYREHTPNIDLVPGMQVAIDDLVRRGVSLAVISDGPYASQAAKVQALRLSKFSQVVVLTDAWGPEYWKPHPRAFQLVRERLQLSADRLVYVGDNPTKDFVSPIALGWAAIRLRLPGQLHETETVFDSGVLEATSVAELHSLVLTLAGLNAVGEDRQWT